MEAAGWRCLFTRPQFPLGREDALGGAVVSSAVPQPHTAPYYRKAASGDLAPEWQLPNSSKKFLISKGLDKEEMAKGRAGQRGKNKITKNFEISYYRICFAPQTLEAIKKA